jgi:tetratricopeptide (TPR) repeat protein
MGPLYPHLLALIYLLFGSESFVPQILQWLLSVGNIGLVYLLARRLTTPTVGVLAALIFALYGAAEFYAGLLLMSAPLTTMYLLTAMQTVRLLEEPTRRGGYVLGVLVGLTALFRGNPLLLLVTLPLLLLTVNLPRRRWLKLGLYLWLGTATVILPVTLRNIVVGRDLVLLTTNSGMNLYLGQRADLQGIFGLLDSDMVVQFDPSGELTLEREYGRDLKGSEVSRIYTQRAWRMALEQPLATFKLYLVKLFRFWNGYEVPQIASYDFWRSRTLALKLMFVPFTLLAASGLAGLVLLRGRLRLVLSVFVGTYFFSMLPFFVTARYRQPIAPLLALATAAVLIAAGQALAQRTENGWRRNPRWRIGLGQLALVLVLVVALLPRWAAFDRAEAQWGIHVNRAGRLVRAGDKAGALAAIREADAAYPDYAVTYLKIGDIHTELEEDEEALAAFLKAEQLAPGECIMPYRVGRTYHRLGLLEEALAAFERCIAIDPSWPRGYFGQAMVHRDRHDFEAAIAAMAEAVEVKPGAVHYRNNLASLYAENGQLEEARRTLTELVTAFENYTKGWINLALVNYNLGRLEEASRVLDRAAAIPHQEPAEEEAIRGIRAMIAAGPPRR